MLAVVVLAAAGSAVPASAEAPDYRLFFEAASTDEKVSKDAFDRIAGAGWHDGYAGLLLDLARFLPRAGTSGPEEPSGADAGSDDPLSGGQRGGFLETGATRAPSPKARARERLIRFLEKQTHQKFGQDLRRWRRWLWGLGAEPHPQYALFKASLYAAVDSKMASFFPPGVQTLVRLDEVDWGGVPVNGIPPLDHPKAVAAKDAAYLDEKNLVFGIALNGEARAYPRRIIGWHEVVRDTVGGVPLTIVYCTLCGTVVPYGSEVAGRVLTLGTSGLLYRSNKLLFDEETRSLWSTNEGRPVIGVLAGSGLELTPYPVVTATWREWVAVHPETTVLSLETGHQRDYAEGAAYREYNATDRIMFEVPKTDDRLKNKAEVLTLLLRPAGVPRDAARVPLAIAADFLRKNPVYQTSFANQEVVVVTSPDGANRVYAAAGTTFVRMATSGRHVVDDLGQTWQITEDALLPDGRDEAAKRRLPARRSYWFGWFAQFPETRLVQ